MSELRPCPFCGSEHIDILDGKEDGDGVDGMSAVCQECVAVGFFVKWDEEYEINPRNEAERRWNTRTHPTLYRFGEEPRPEEGKPYLAYRDGILRGAVIFEEGSDFIPYLGSKLSTRYNETLILVPIPATLEEAEK